jgi:hypothetical protein
LLLDAGEALIEASELEAELRVVDAEYAEAAWIGYRPAILISESLRQS